jgi:TP901 family phage tail tape measure protein
MSTAAFSEGIRNVQSQLTRMSKTVDKTAKKMRRAGRAMTLNLTAPLAAISALSVTAAGDFEAAMNRVAAVSGATGEQLKALTQLAKDMGRETQFSASQAAAAMGFLAQAGFKTNEIIGALPGTLQLAASAQIELGEAADIVSNILSGYGLEVEQLSRVNDVLVKTFTSSNTNLQQLGEAMTYVGPVAAAAGVQFEETAAAVGLLGNAGIQASMAGTTLRGSISRMLNPSSEAKKIMSQLGLAFTDAHGRLLPLNQVIEQLAPHADNAGVFLELFGDRAGPGMAALVSQGAGALRQLTLELENAGGTAQKIAEAQMKGFNGMIKRLVSVFEALQIAVAGSGVLEFFTKMGSGLADLVQKLAQVDPAILRVVTVIAALAAGIGPVILVLSGMAAAITLLLSPIGLTVAAIAALVAAATSIYIFRDTIMDALKSVGRILIDVLVAPIRLTIKALLNQIQGAIDFAKKVASALGLEGLKQKMEGLSGTLEAFANREIVRFGDTAEKFADAAEGMKEKVKETVQGLKDSLSTPIALPPITQTAMQVQIPDIKVEANTYGPLLTATERATETMRDRFEDLGRSIGDSVGAGVARGEGFFASLKSTVSNTIQSMIQSVISSGIQKIFSSVFGMFFGGGGAGFGAISSVFGGFFAKGGMPPSNRISVVGEDRPELFVPPGMGGRIIPGDQLGPSGGVTVNIDARGAQDGLLERLRQVMQTEVAAITRGTVDMRLASLSKAAG